MLVSTLIATIGLAFSVRAWGDLGHKTVANVARQLMAHAESPYVLQTVNAILAADAFIPPDQPSPTLVDIASWADSFSATKKGQFSKGYHYIATRDNPASDCGIDMRRDCNGTGGCIVKAIANYTWRLSSPDANQTPQETADYLKFLVHFVADVAQPLHTDAYENGGNAYMIRWGNQQKTLHGIWDNEMVDKIVDIYNGMELWTTTIVREIEHGVYRNPEWVTCASYGDPLNCALEWAKESNKLVCSHVLRFNPADDLSKDYFDKVAPVIEEQIAKAGARLAALLIRIFGSVEPREIPLATERITVQRGDL